MKTLHILSCLLVVGLCVAQQENERVPARMHSFKAPFYLVRGNIPFWTFGGSTVVTDDYVRLTPLEQSRRGWIWNTKPVMFPSWETIVTFKISGGGGLGADGMAIWYVQETNREGSAWGSQPAFKGLGVAFDTFDNDGLGNNPYVSVFVNDGTWELSGVDDGKSQQVGGCRSQFRHNQAKVKITYNDNILTVELDTANTGQWSPCARVTDVQLPTGYFFGVSAETGGLFDTHDVMSFETSQIPKQGQYIPPQRTNPNPTPRDRWGQPNNEPQRQQEKPQEQQQPVDDDTQALLDKLNRMKEDDSAQQQQQPPVPQQPAVPQQQVPVQQQQQQVPQNAGGDWQLIINEINSLKQRQDSIQQSLSGLQQTLNTLSTQGDTATLKKIQEQQQTFAEVLNRLLLNGIKKEDLKNLGIDPALLRELEALRESITKATNFDTLTRQLEGLSRSVNEMKGKIDQASQKTATFEKNLRSNTEQLSETIERSTSFGFWTYFIIFQLIFGVAFMWWKKYTDDNGKKLI